MPQSVPPFYRRSPYVSIALTALKVKIFQETKAEQLSADAHLSRNKYFKLNNLKGLTFIITYLYLYSRASGAITDYSVISKIAVSNALFYTKRECASF